MTAAKESFMKEKPVFPLLMSMALPMVISMLVNSLYNIVDSFFVAKISEDAMTALSLVFPVQNLINAVAIGFGIGMNAQISYHMGAGNYHEADKAATQGAVLSAIQGILMSVAGIAVMPSFLRLFTSDETVIDLGIRYSNIVFTCSAVIGLSLAYEKIFQAVGRMKATMTALICGCVTNIILDPIMIFGIGFCPEMGIEGAALATIIGQIVNLLIYPIAGHFNPTSVRIRRDCMKPDRVLIGKLYAIGTPAVLNIALPSLLISVLNGLLAAYSQSYVVILGIYYKLQTFLYLPASGIVQGMRPIIGYNYGAGEHKRVRQIYKTTLYMSCLIMLAGTIICLSVPESLIGMFSTNPETISMGKTALRIICAGFLISSVSVTTSGALEGLGKGTPSLCISLTRYVVVILPAAFLLSRIFGAVGVWNAFWIAEFAAAAISIFLTRKEIFSGLNN